ncbi:MAG: hypothetical protein JXI33_06865 [Candidatus Aminicenantes bacterium]|nr:hypothetical protein [Candidatus Aminicenantes bacterium]
MNIKKEFPFLFPAPKTIRLQNRTLDIQSLCFPLEITKKYDFLFEYFHIKNKNRGLEITCQEKKTLAAEEYVIECDQTQVVIGGNSLRGQFYALSTLLQILAYYQPGGRMPGFIIEDAPKLGFRGFLLAVEHGAFPLQAELQRLLLKLALLRFNQFSLSLAAWSGEEENAGNTLPKENLPREEMNQIIDLAGKMGIDFVPAIVAGPALHLPDIFSAGILASFRSRKIMIRFNETTESDPAAEWFERFLNTYRLFKAHGKTMLIWGDAFLKVPDLIRKMPKDVVVLSGDGDIERTEMYRRKAGPFRKHHIPQVLCTATWGRARFIPAMRKSAVNNLAAYAAVKEEKLAGILLKDCQDQGDGSFLEGIILGLYQAGNLFWSGQAPGPEAFARWALGFNEPDLFRIYTFLSQVDSPLQHSHWQYLFEDPLCATFSKQDNVKEIVARYRKASQYLKKRKIVRNEMSDFLNIAQHLYEFVAEKVDFSSRLLSGLNAIDGDAHLQRKLDRLLADVEKLKNLFCALWLKRRKPYGLAKKVRRFDFLQERLNYLLLSMAHPAARKILLSELENGTPPMESRRR